MKNNLIDRTRKKWGKEKLGMLKYKWSKIKPDFLLKKYPKRIAMVLSKLDYLDHLTTEELSYSYFFHGEAGHWKTVSAARILLQHRKNFEYNIPWSKPIRDEVDKYPTYAFTSLLNFFSEIKETYNKECTTT